MSVTDKADAPASGDKYDYMSLARYYWPDASKPDGLPYVIHMLARPAMSPKWP